MNKNIILLQVSFYYFGLRRPGRFAPAAARRAAPAPLRPGASPHPAWPHPFGLGLVRSGFSLPVVASVGRDVAVVGPG
ncbi:predicted protein [Histoplasma mississippiense (nom. inval.)]|uniref:predicted protein n=1 Tax=Ajellomyces capsulatus (strain NAm1 / WU24) TaxID=2059318 RepID=UPI000157BFF7|nr:predicted protein [Histoplasma mississippiense (nom. inval.)]EDN06604.1 predicted protein [Histoplasma mississippiense (nom. inval.)]